MITPPSTNINVNYTHANSSPHSPHTAPDPMVDVQPVYSQQHSISSPSSDYQHLDYSSSTTTTTNSPHTAVPHYDSPNPNPQLGHVQLDFIPLPTSQPSAPPQPSTAPLTYVAPPVPSPFSVPYPVPPSAITQQQPKYENVTFVDATPIDMSNKNYKLSSAAGGSTFIQNLRNPKKKTFWIFSIIALAIIFGVLGGTVWKPDNKNAGNNNETRSKPSSSSSATGPVYSNPAVPTPVGPGTSVAPPVVPTPVEPGVSTSVAPPVVPTPVVVPTTPVPVAPKPQPTSNPPPPSPPPPQPSSGGGNGGYLDCRNACNAVSNKCDDNCRATDSAYKSCDAKCSTSSDQFCEYDCRANNACFGSCLSAWGTCSQACG